MRMPIVIAHRGASGYRPEHSLAAYQLALDMGADTIETDLVVTRDGALIARHENELSGSTDIAARPEFADRWATKQIDGTTLTGWFSEDLTLAEIKSLRCREPLPQLRSRSRLYDGRYAVATLDEILALVRRNQSRQRRMVGLNIEIKHSSYFAGIGLGIEQPLIAALERAGFSNADEPIFLQSFEVEHLQGLRKLTRLPIIQLIDEAGQPADFAAQGDPRSYADMLRPEGLREIASYAQGIGPGKGLIIPRDGDGRLLAPTDLIDAAHAVGLFVHAWTFRNENAFLPAEFRHSDGAEPIDDAGYGDAFAEFALFLGLGIDGLISDNPDTAVEAVAQLTSGQ